MRAAVPDDGGGDPVEMSAQPVPAWLEEPPVGTPPLLVRTRPQVLPFEGLTPENFERMVLRRVRCDPDVEHAQLYGVRGQDQHGIDLYCRLRKPGPSGRWYRTVQCRNVAVMTATDIAAAVEDFVEGRWASKSEAFAIATRVSAVRTERADAVEAAAEKLRPAGVRFEIWDGEELSHQLRAFPELVEAFFGAEAAGLFCPAAGTPSRELGGPVTEQMLRDRLAQLPPMLESRLISAFRDEPDVVWRLVTVLTGIDASPATVVEEWQGYQPPWLAYASWQAQVAAAEVAAGYGAGFLAAGLLMVVAEQGAVRRCYWLARAASLYYDLDDRAGWEAAVAAMGPADGVTDPYARAMIAWLTGDIRAAEREVTRWTPADPIDRNVRAVLRMRLAVTPTPDAVFTRESLDRGLVVLRDALREQWSPGLALVRARLLIVRYGRGEATFGSGDLREARELALRARDDRRTYRGDSAEAVALACQAAVMVMDRAGAIELGTVGPDGATAEEADSPAVCEYVTLAAITLGDFDLARDRIARVTVPSVQARLEALLAEARGIDAQPYFRRAVELAVEDDQLAQALVGMARSGAGDLPRLEELAVRHPAEAAEIRAVADLFQGRADEAIARLRPRRRDSVTAALNLVEAYRRTGDMDGCVQTLRDAAVDFNDPDLRQNAAEILASAGRRNEAEQELESLLASTGPNWAGRPDALRLAAQLAYEDGRHDEAASRLRTLLEIQPQDTRSRWALIRVLVDRGDLTAARRAMSNAPDPLEPADAHEAQLWIHLHRGQIPLQQWVAGCLRLLRQFGSSERFSAYVISTLVGPDAGREPLPDSLLAELHQEFERFFDLWPASTYLRRLSGEDITQLVAQMTDAVRTSQEERTRRRRLIRALRFSQVPLALLAAATGRSTAEIAVRRGIGVLRARHGDPGEITACADGVRVAAGQDVVIDTTAIATLAALPGALRDATLGAFSRVVTTDDTLRDAHIGNDALSLRSTDSWIYDEHTDTGRLAQIPQAEADRLADQAALLLSTAESLARHPRPVTRIAASLDSLNLAVAGSIVDLAHHRQTAMWSDDPFVRLAARQTGVTAFSTPAVLDYLVQQRLITADQYEAALRTLIKEHIGDMPFDETRLLELAEDENWRSGSVAVVLGQPASWADRLRTLRLFGRIVGLARAHDPDALPGWLHQAVQGAVTHAGSPDNGAAIAARLLAIAVLESHAHGQPVANLVGAVRQALADTDDPDAPPTPDPLTDCAILLRHIYGRALSYDLATQYVIATFAALPQPDRDEVVRALLR